VEAALMRRWDGCNTDDDRRAVVREAQKRLYEIQYSPDPDSRPGTKEWKRKVALDERAVPVVARVFRVSTKRVRNLRRQLREGKLNL
jgi:hypothetical protein